MGERSNFETQSIGSDGVNKFCGECGARTVRKVPEYDTLERSVCPRCGTIFYESPIVLVGCQLMCGNRMLWLKRGHPPRAGYWTPGPMGYVEPRESLQVATVREIKEELDIDVEPRQLDLLGVGSLERMNQILIGFCCELEAELGTPSDEAIEVAWFSEDEAPWGELAFDDTEPFVRAYYAWIREGRPTQGLNSLPVILKAGLIDRLTRRQ